MSTALRWSSLTVPPPRRECVRHRDAAYANPPHHVGAADQNVAVLGQCRLHDAGARLPLVLPESVPSAGATPVAPASAQKNDLHDAVDGREMW